jgi:hypothetical protein
MLGFNATGRLDRVDFASWFNGEDFELDSALTHTSFPREVDGSLALLRTARVKTPPPPSSSPTATGRRSSAVAGWGRTQFGLSKERAFRRPGLQPFGALRPQECLRGEIDRAGVVGNLQNLVFAFSARSQMALLLADWKKCITLTPMSDFASSQLGNRNLRRSDQIILDETIHTTFSFFSQSGSLIQSYQLLYDCLTP